LIFEAEMKRYYICKIIGDGQEPETAFRPAIQDVIDQKTGAPAFSIASVIATDPTTGLPVFPWALVIASGTKHGLVQNHPDIDPLPDYPFDAKVSAMHAPTKNGMVGKMQARGINTAFIGVTDGYREIIRTLGRQHFSDFDENNFDVAE
jgi:hypothetical protein